MLIENVTGPIEPVYVFYHCVFQKQLGTFLRGTLSTRMSPNVYWRSRTCFLGIFTGLGPMVHC